MKLNTSTFQRLTSQKPYPEIRGTHTGYMIRYTCPACCAESTIVSNSPRDHYRSVRVVSCHQCQARLTLRTPGGLR